jgi:hypothetical protein
VEAVCAGGGAVAHVLGAHVLGAHVLCAADVLRSPGMISRWLSAESAPLIRLGEMRRLGLLPAIQCLPGHHVLAGTLGNG